MEQLGQSSEMLLLSNFQKMGQMVTPYDKILAQFSKAKF